jgi:pyrimidine operon attenuation protein/uracil phosphoribosyltransferase
MADERDARRGRYEEPTLMNADAIERALRRMAREIVDRTRGGELAIVGIRRGGVYLAHRLKRELAQVTGRDAPVGSLDNALNRDDLTERELAQVTGRDAPVGSLDIALYRDDLSERAPSPVVGPTDIPFPVTGKTIVLVDDVLYTGRTVRAALDELVDFGRPRRVLLVVLVDRGGRELPIAPDVVGAVVEVPDTEQVELRLKEAGDAEDAVVVRGRGVRA